MKNSIRLEYYKKTNWQKNTTKNLVKIKVKNKLSNKKVVWQKILVNLIKNKSCKKNFKNILGFKFSI